MIWDFWRGWEATRSSETVRWEGSSKEDGGDDIVGLLLLLLWMGMAGEGVRRGSEESGFTSSLECIACSSLGTSCYSGSS